VDINGQCGHKGIGRKISRGGQRKKDRKIAKRPKMPLLNLFQRGANGKKTEK